MKDKFAYYFDHSTLTKNILKTQKLFLIKRKNKESSRALNSVIIRI